MCGIIACVGTDDAVRRLVGGLENLEYRGYDSAGIAVQNGDGLTVHKNAGKISELKHSLVEDAPSGTLGIGHTRWSTHGPPTDANAHPHAGETGDVAVVHNGIIENYDELRDRLRAEGRTFTSDTDTEVVPHLVESHREETGDLETAFRRAVAEIEGSYAVVAVAEAGEVVYGARQDSPLVVGYGDGEHYLASDVPAFLEYTDEVSYLEDGDVVAITSDEVRITDGDRRAISRRRETIDWSHEETEKGPYDHFMRKEIDAQPGAITNTLQGRVADSATSETSQADGDSVARSASGHSSSARVEHHETLDANGEGGPVSGRRGVRKTAEPSSTAHQKSSVSEDGDTASTEPSEAPAASDSRTDDARETAEPSRGPREEAVDREVDLEDFPPGAFADVETVQFVACGTSYHAALYAARLLNKADVPAHAYRASEYASGEIPVRENTLVVAVTQSGETADTLAALRVAQQKGARTTTVTNVVNSTAAREVETPLYIRAGPEIGVAATKTFSSQVVALALLTERIAEDASEGRPRADRAEFLDSLQRLPGQIETVLGGSDPEHVCRRHVHEDAYFFIGQGTAHPVALEGALKFKEITYEHAEGFAAGELKHGPLALVTPDTVVVAVFTGGERDEKTLNNAKEVQARGADIVAVAPEGVDVSDCTDEVIRVPRAHPDLTSILTNVQLQLLSYHAADMLNREIDKPRNLAKSVTVE